MTCDDVCNFLDSIEMGVYKKSFRAQEINGEAMLELNEADMLALKLTSPSERYAHRGLIVVISRTTPQREADDGHLAA